MRKRNKMIRSTRRTVTAAATALVALVDGQTAIRLMEMPEPRPPQHRKQGFRL